MEPDAAAKFCAWCDLLIDDNEDMITAYSNQPSCSELTLHTE
jgi:hypothetical protein